VTQEVGCGALWPLFRNFYVMAKLAGACFQYDRQTVPLVLLGGGSAMD
jgi:hypothetical protein